MSKLLIYLLSFGTVITLAGLPSPTTLILPFMVMLLFITLHGLYVAAEFAIIRVHTNELEDLAEGNDDPAQEILTTVNSPQQQNIYIATAQVGITLTSLGLGMYGEPHIAAFIAPHLTYLFTELMGITINPTFSSILTYLVAISLLTYFHVIFGDMLPKSLAVSNSTQTAIVLSRLMKPTQTILQYPVMALTFIGMGFLKLMRIPTIENHARIHSPEELEQIVSDSAEEGLFKEAEQEIILNIFDFSDRQVGQVMTPRRKVEAIPHDMPLPEIENLVSESKYSRFPVYQDSLDQKIVGILHVNDLVHHQIQRRKTGRDNFDLRLVVRPAPVVPEQFPINKLLVAFRRQRIHMAIVLDEFGGTAGIVTLENLVEQVVGEVRDEFDLEHEPLVELGPGQFELSGRYLVEDLVDDVKIDLGDAESLPDVETVGGLITTELGRPPQMNDRVTYNNNVHFTVLTVDGLAVGRARVEIPVESGRNEEEHA